MIILYNKAECPFCWRIRMALDYLGLAWENRVFDDPRWEIRWRSLTDTGTVPVMEADGQVLTDSADMLEYLHEHVGPLWPELTEESREFARDWDRKLGKAIREVVFAKRDIPEDEWDLDRIAAGEREWLSLLPALETRLGGRDAFFARLGLVDMIFATRFGLAGAYGLPAPTWQPGLERWFSRVRRQTWFIHTQPDIVAARFEGQTPWTGTTNTD